jgi:oxygen-independent coproporphyrinogen-3 oxidase
MAGIYVHIPFCAQACSYCNFHFSTSLKLKDEVVDALVAEIGLRAGYLSDPIQSIYFGGGTPSLLHPLDIERILKALHKDFDLSGVSEFTFEANPEDLTTSYCKALRKLGVDRLSIGIQSFFDDDLKAMNRAHNKDQSFRAIENSKSAGYNNLNIDLIYGLPWATDLKKIWTLLHSNLCLICRPMP